MPEDRNPGVAEDSPRTRSQNGVGGGGRQVGGGPEPVDNRAPGGSTGTGAYGKMQNQQNMQGQAEKGPRTDPGLSRGERFDAEQGGGRGVDSVRLDEEDRGSGA